MPLLFLMSICWLKASTCLRSSSVRTESSSTSPATVDTSLADAAACGADAAACAAYACGAGAAVCAAYACGAGAAVCAAGAAACAAKCRGQGTTLSMVDLAEFAAAVPDKMTKFADSISELLKNKEYQTVSAARNGAREFASSSKIDQVDLVHLAENMGNSEGKELAKAIRSAVKYNRTSSGMTNAYGVSIYFPYKRTSYVDSAVRTYDQIGMDASYSRCIREFASLEVSA